LQNFKIAAGANANQNAGGSVGAGINLSRQLNTHTTPIDAKNSSVTRPGPLMSTV